MVSVPLVLAVVAATLSATHATTPSCGCVAQQQGFRIDCTQQAVFNVVMNTLDTQCRGLPCSANSTCAQAFLIASAHHDYCAANDLPATLEDLIHDFEKNCTGCSTQKRFISGLPTCPTVDCTNATIGINAHNAMVAANCLTSCSSTACGQYFRIIKMYHDTCPENVADQFEDYLHDAEDVCAAQGCNAPDSGSFNPNVCGPQRSGAATTWLAGVAVAVASMLVANTALMA